MTLTNAGMHAPPTRSGHRTPGDAAIEDLLCDAAAADDREGLLSLLSGHLAVLTGAARVHLVETAAEVSDVLAGDPPAAPGRLELLRTPALTAVLHGPAGLTGEQREMALRALRWGAAALRLL